MRIVRIILLLMVMAMSSHNGMYAQLKKTANIEKVKTFTNGSVVLNKTTKDSVSIYSVTLRNNSKFHENIVFFLGTEDDLLKNLRDLSNALKDGKKGDNFDFSAIGVDYNLSYDKVLGQVCFKIRKPSSISTDFGRLYKATIDDIIEYYTKEDE